VETKQSIVVQLEVWQTVKDKVVFFLLGNYPASGV